MSEYCDEAGKILHIDLSGETISEYPWSKQDQAQYLGGKIMAQKIFCDLLTGEETAYSEQNPVVITAGPLTGTGAPGSIRFDIAALSPKDDLPAFSNCGGYFGLSLKKAGYCGLILTGRCKERRWLEIRQDKVVFHKGQQLWGSRVSECEAALQQVLGQKDIGKLCIGPAGENLVKFASVLSDGHTAGRAGIGAVLGWKNLKAIAVTGNTEICYSNPEKGIPWNRAWHMALKQCAQTEKSKGEGVCAECPLHCPKHKKEENRTLNELGMDAFAAAEAVQWAQEQGFSATDMETEIAYRRGIGNVLAEGDKRPAKHKGSRPKRRGRSSRAIVEAFGLPPDAPDTEVFCRNLTEAICAAGQCMFTVNGLQPDTPELPVLKMLEYVTGLNIDLDALLRIGEHSQELEQQLQKKFLK